MFPDRPIILVSKSPRRSQLLQEAGFGFTVHPLDVNEDFSSDMPPEEVAEYLARRKALAGAHLIKKDEIILAADSTVLLDGEIYNKPADHADAVRMIRRLSGRTHRVVTGVCLLAMEKEVSFSGITDVTFAELTDQEIDFYVRLYQPFDKAGAYGVQEWLGLCKITRLEGTYSNVMGLPVDMVYARLQLF